MSNVHILVFPYPAQGHMLPLLDLTHHLTLKGLTITIIITPKNLNLLNPLLSTHPNTIQTLILPFPTHPNISPGAENIREVGNTGNIPFMNALSKLQNPIIQWLASHPDPPVALISDFFLGWTHRIGIPRLAFYSSGAFLTAISNRCWRNPRWFQSQAVVEFAGIPGTPSFRGEHLPSLILRYRESDPESEFVRELFAANAASWGTVFNTFGALEGPYLDHIRAELGHPRVFAVGPLGSNRVEPDPDGGSDVIRWLDGWEEEGSVLYVCFGSQKLLRKEQMEALAFGLERSGTRFVWVVKAPSTAELVEEGYGLLPDGFEDRVSGRGLVVRGWAPQVAILGHRVVGGFLSHCGWNSVLEAVVAGVAILGWPMEADQFVNARLLVEDVQMAVRVCEGANSVPDPDELGRAISGSMSGDSPQKRRAKLMREEAVRAVSDNGDSSKELDELVEALKQLGVKEG
ncbi:UDP-glycosyltransferase 89A2-like [Gastrolobium bilobum]|uniref:UDP-glycosyltransferase 89A2-like n=1 Tax=Gastrolobium bilobum TaxID=150636 RepID=UPI002AB1035B|nr:UDP-glycosyltransferase 89A2-like [Gastrolobium bilobum]XP_061375320.1 UDP-glycosyltransferase 89A2-like [Gastrolobium bilobum]